MTRESCWQSFKAEGNNVADRISALIRDGNVRRVVIEHGGKTVAEFPLLVGVVGVIAAPLLAAVGTFVALLKDCTIHVEVAPAGAAVPAGGPTEHAAVDVEC